MKISMNNIGNYTPSMKTSTDISQKFNIDTNNDLKTKSTETVNSTVTPEEKDYFMDLYPENKNEISDYHFYQRSGKMSGVKIGSLIDRRG
jgi:hypothetical protein